MVPNSYSQSRVKKKRQNRSVGAQGGEWNGRKQEVVAHGYGVSLGRRRRKMFSNLVVVVVAQPCENAKKD